MCIHNGNPEYTCNECRENERKEAIENRQAYLDSLSTPEWTEPN